MPVLDDLTNLRAKAPPIPLTHRLSTPSSCDFPRQPYRESIIIGIFFRRETRKFEGCHVPRHQCSY